MKKRYSLVCLSNRGGTFYCYDSTTGKRESLGTKIRHEADCLMQTKNEAVRQPAMNLPIEQVHLHHMIKLLAPDGIFGISLHSYRYAWQSAQGGRNARAFRATSSR